MKKALSLTALATAAALAAVFTSGAQAQQAAVKQLKFQSTWPASLTLQDNFRYFAERFDKLTRGEVKIEAMAAGQIVPAFEILDATHKKVIDGGHGVAYYWVGKNKTATLFSATPAGLFPGYACGSGLCRPCAALNFGQPLCVTALLPRFC